MPEHESDAPAIEALLDRCFGKTRTRKTAQKLRKDRVPANGLAFVMLSEAEDVIGTLRFWHILAGDVPALLLGPVAVAPEYQKRGLGKTLINFGLARACSLGHCAVLLVGDAPYYGRFGFARELTFNLKLPGPVDEARFLGLELQPGSLTLAQGMVQAAGRIAEKKAPKRQAA